MNYNIVFMCTSRHQIENLLQIIDVLRALKFDGETLFTILRLDLCV